MSGRGVDRSFEGALLGVLALMVVGCPPTRPSERGDRTGTVGESDGPTDRQVVARVNDERLSIAELERRIEELPEYARARYRTAGKRQEYVKSLVRFEVMADIAESRGLGDAPEVRDGMEAALQRDLLESKLREKVSVNDVSEEAIEARYEENRETYRTPAQRRTAIIAAESRSRLESLRESLVEREYESIRKKVKRFRTLAARESVDPETNRKGGFLGWVSEPEADGDHPDVARVVFASDEKGTITRIFEYGDRWAIALWDRHRDAEVESLDDVARSIRRELYEERRRETRESLLDEWRSDAEVEVDEGLEERLEAPAKSESVTRMEEIPLVAPSELEEGQ